MLILLPVLGIISCSLDCLVQPRYEGFVLCYWVLVCPVRLPSARGLLISEEEIEKCIKARDVVGGANWSKEREYYGPGAYCERIYFQLKK